MTRGRRLLAACGSGLVVVLGAPPASSAPASSAPAWSAPAWSAPASRASAPPAPPAASAASAAECEEGRTQYLTDTPDGLLRLGATRAWPLATGAGVTVAVVDSGVAAANAHFPGGVVLDGRSLVGGSPTTDRRLHGTAVAGIIAARPLGPRSGVVGLAKDARILPVKVVADERDPDEGPDADAAVLAEAVRWAASAGASVVNVSLSTSRDDPRLRAAVREATARGALVVASAGTAGPEDALPVTGPRFPAAYPEVLGVAAVDGDDVAVDTSVRGAHVDVAAPGVDVLTTFGTWGDCYLGADGSTSYATAYVSAAAALVAQRFPHETPAQWAHRLQATAARERRDARDDAVGWGVVQPVEALTAVLDAGVAGPLPPGAQARPSVATPIRRLEVTEVADPQVVDRRVVLWVAVVGASVLLGLSLLRLFRRPPAA